MSLDGPKPQSNSDATAVLLSGGLDSAIVLAIVARTACRAIPLYVKSGLFWEAEELRAARKICGWFEENVSPLVQIDFPVASIYGDHWSLTGQNPPGADSSDEAVFLPGRNLLLLSVAGLWCRQRGVTRLAIGTLDTNPFSDASEVFFTTLEGLLNSYGPPEVQFIRPLAGMTKTDAMNWARELPLEETFSCIAPIGGLHCGWCNKCAERQRAFQQSGIPDRTEYAPRDV